jgi:hypothetical protein
MVIREQINASKLFFQGKDQGQIVDIAQRIISRRWGDISQFINAQRQQGIVLPANYKSVSYPDMDLEYTRIGKQETLNMMIYPEQESSEEKQGHNYVNVNYDGYVAWVHWQQRELINGVPYVVGPFDIFLNDYLLIEKFVPRNPCGAYVVLFGKTALLCESYQDDDGRTNNKLIQSNPRDTIPAVQPRGGWGFYPNGSSPTGVPQNNVTKQLGYWIFDNTNPLSPTDYIGGQGYYQTWDELTQNTGVIVFSEGLWFETAEDCPIQYQGGNTLSWQVSPTGVSGEVRVAGFGIAEFYNRTNFRNVTQSWVSSLPTTDDTLAINDSPIIWLSGYNEGGFWNGSRIDFDLTPGDDDTASNIHGSVSDHSDVPPNGGPGLSDDETAKLNQWRSEVMALANAYNISLIPLYQAFNNYWNTPDNLKLLNQANNIEGFWLASTDANGNKLPSVQDDYAHAPGVGHIEVYGPVQQYLWNWNANYNTDGHAATQGIARWFASFNLVTQMVDFVDTGSNPGIDFSNSPTGSFQSVTEFFAFCDAYVKSPTNPIKVKQMQYDQIAIDHPPPVYPLRPKVGKDYTVFSYRTITIDGDNWSYPAKFSKG